MEWLEFRIWYGEKLDRDKLYALRKALLPILNRHKIENFLVLNEPNFVVFRVEVDEDIMNDIKKSLQSIIYQSENAFSRVTVDKWFPEQDAKNRILGAAQRAGLELEEGKGWMIKGRDSLEQRWIPAEDDLELKITEFSIFMKKVVGKFTRAYIEEMPRSIEDRWLLSVLLHLLLNSISINQIQEKEIREFPYI